MPFHIRRSRDQGDIIQVNDLVQLFRYCFIDNAPAAYLQSQFKFWLGSYSVILNPDPRSRSHIPSDVSALMDVISCRNFGIYWIITYQKPAFRLICQLKIQGIQGELEGLSISFISSFVD